MQDYSPQNAQRGAARIFPHQAAGDAITDPTAQPDMQQRGDGAQRNGGKPITGGELADQAGAFQQGKSAAADQPQCVTLVRTQLASCQ